MALSPAQVKLLASMPTVRSGEHGLLVSGHEYRTALSLERMGLASVRYQGPTMGWALKHSTGGV